MLTSKAKILVVLLSMLALCSCSSSEKLPIESASKYIRGVDSLLDTSTKNRLAKNIDNLKETTGEEIYVYIDVAKQNYDVNKALLSAIEEVGITEDYQAMLYYVDNREDCDQIVLSNNMKDKITSDTIEIINNHLKVARYVSNTEYGRDARLDRDRGLENAAMTYITNIKVIEDVGVSKSDYRNYILNESSKIPIGIKVIFWALLLLAFIGGYAECKTKL